MTKRRILIIDLVLVLLILGVILTQPLVVHRLASKVFTAYEIYLLKYPNSRLVNTEIRATTKVTMATDYSFYSSDRLDTVLGYMEQKRPGFVQLQGSHVIEEPTFRNITCAGETMLRNIFQILDIGHTCIEVSIYPSAAGGTSILMSENWFSMGFPDWLRSW